MDNVPDRITFSAARIGFYLFSSLWLFFFHVLEDSAVHFGGGFFWMAASVVIVPLVICALCIDLIMRVADARTLRANSVMARITAVAIPAILFFGSVGWMYHEYTL